MSHQEGTDNRESSSDWDENDEVLSKSENRESKGEIFYGEDYEESYYNDIRSYISSRTEKEIVNDSNYRVLNCLESGSVISILEDLTQEIIILKYVIAAPVVSEWNFRYKTLKERFSDSHAREKIFPEVDSMPVLTTPLKLLRDRQLIENVIKDTIKALLEDGTFEPVCEAAFVINQEHKDEENLIQEFRTNLKNVRDLRKKMEEKKRLNDLEEKQRDELLYKLQDEIDDVILKCSMDEQFVEKWEQTRDKQNKWRLKNSENFYRNKISDLNSKSAAEARVNAEMQLCIKRYQMELEEQLDEWMTRYDAEMERRENKILQLKYMRDQTEDEVKRLGQLYESRKIEIKEWTKFRNLMKRRSAASLLIQSWWRGFMVRKKLGPYGEKKVKHRKQEK